MTQIRNALWAAMVLYGLLYAAAHAQQPTPAEQIGVLTTRLGVAERSINEAYLALIREQNRATALAKDLADAEAQKATLIQWLKDAQAKAAKPVAQGNGQ